MAVRQSPVFVVMRIDDTFDAENNQEKRLNDMSIKINDLTVTFKNKVTGINHANLEIPNGVFGLLGENGAGKTTLMRVLTIVLTPTSGTVSMDGILYCEGNYPKIQRQIGYLPQEIDLYPGLTVQECLEYMGDLAGVPKEECRKRIRYYLEKTSLTGHRKKKMKQLSGGIAVPFL